MERADEELALVIHSNPTARRQRELDFGKAKLGKSILGAIDVYLDGEREIRKFQGHPEGTFEDLLHEADNDLEVGERGFQQTKQNILNKEEFYRSDAEATVREHRYDELRQKFFRLERDRQKLADEVVARDKKLEMLGRSECQLREKLDEIKEMARTLVFLGAAASDGNCQSLPHMTIPRDIGASPHLLYPMLRESRSRSNSQNTVEALTASTDHNNDLIHRDESGQLGLLSSSGMSMLASNGEASEGGVELAATDAGSDADSTTSVSSSASS